MKWEPKPAPVVNMAQCGKEVEIDPKNFILIEHPDEPYLVIVMGFESDHAGARFTHPNIVRSREKKFEYKHYGQSGNKWWTSHPGTEHVLVVPRTAINLRLVETTGYVEIEIGGHVIRLNNSWGSWGKGTTADFLYDEVGTCVNHPVADLKAVANAAVRGTHFEPYLFYDEKEP